MFNKNKLSLISRNTNYIHFFKTHLQGETNINIGKIYIHNGNTLFDIATFKTFLKNETMKLQNNWLYLLNSIFEHQKIQQILLQNADQMQKPGASNLSPSALELHLELNYGVLFGITHQQWLMYCQVFLKYYVLINIILNQNPKLAKRHIIIIYSKSSSIWLQLHQHQNQI